MIGSVGKIWGVGIGIGSYILSVVDLSALLIGKGGRISGVGTITGVSSITTYSGDYLFSGKIEGVGTNFSTGFISFYFFPSGKVFSFGF